MILHEKGLKLHNSSGEIFARRREIWSQKMKISTKENSGCGVENWIFFGKHTKKRESGNTGVVTLHHQHIQLLHDLIHPHNFSLFYLIFQSGGNGNGNCRMIRSFFEGRNGVFIAYSRIRIYTQDLATDFHLTFLPVFTRKMVFLWKEGKELFRQRKMAEGNFKKKKLLNKFTFHCRPSKWIMNIVASLELLVKMQILCLFAQIATCSSAANFSR
jgi:hypothetical protein